MFTRMNSTKDYFMTVIVPVFNEIDNMKRLEKELLDYMKTARLASCILFVDDGSTDGSTEAIKEMCARNKDMFYLAFEKNCGNSAAMKAGIDHADSTYVGYIDADLQTIPQDFNLLAEYADKYTLVTGVRANRKDTFAKRIQSKIGNAFRRMMTGDDAKDTGCPLKLIRTENAKKMPLFTGLHRFVPALIALQNGTVKQVPIHHFPRTAGKSKYTMWNRLIGPLNDCFAYRWMKTRYINYKVKDSDL